jgi:hypothetical protein
MVIWYIFPVSVCCDNEKLATLASILLCTATFSQNPAQAKKCFDPTKRFLACVTRCLWKINQNVPVMTQYLALGTWAHYTYFCISESYLRFE